MTDKGVSTAYSCSPITWQPLVAAQTAHTDCKLHLSGHAQRDFPVHSCCVQVSESGRYVATFFKHTVFVYSTQRPAMQPLKLYHTRLITVSALPNHSCCAAPLLDIACFAVSTACTACSAHITLSACYCACMVVYSPANAIALFDRS